TTKPPPVDRAVRQLGRLGRFCRSVEAPMHGPFAAIDFETATPQRDSACAVGVCVVDSAGVVLPPRVQLIRPPQGRADDANYRVHGIGWHRLKEARPFKDVWPLVAAIVGASGAGFLAAHNAPFDRGVAEACCRSAGLPAPTLPWVCTLALAKKRWGSGGNKLPQNGVVLGNRGRGSPPRHRGYRGRCLCPRSASSSAAAPRARRSRCCGATTAAVPPAAASSAAENRASAGHELHHPLPESRHPSSRTPRRPWRIHRTTASAETCPRRPRSAGQRRATSATRTGPSAMIRAASSSSSSIDARTVDLPRCVLHPRIMTAGVPAGRRGAAAWWGFVGDGRNAR